jgi:hypothetical protein
VKNERFAPRRDSIVQFLSVTARLLAETQLSKVILISNHDPEDIGEMVSASGATGFIDKKRLAAKTIIELMS